MLIPASPSLGNKVICRYPGFTFQTFVEQYESIILSPFLKGFPFQLSKNASHTPSFINNFWSQTLPHDFEPFLILLGAYQDGVPDRASILQDWTHHTFISCFLHILGTGEKSSRQETKCSIGFSANIADMRIPFQIICNCHTKVFDINYPHFRELHLLRYRKPVFYSNVFLSAASCCI